ncbi:MAG: helix-turn-helix domain-containing protein [Clostridiales Family XIII bacterium]|jgi:transcriptional regulator with XRE-family HTH domain|nr:helix-turn-helix domain-containing protein [Clostridiales Family XIII bacterium]
MPVRKNKESKDRFDFKPIGLAIKRERMARGLSREALAEICDISDGYIKSIENTGKNPGFQLFWQLVTMFDISVDEYFYKDREPHTSSKLRNILGLIREVGNDDIYLVESIAKELTHRNRKNDKDGGKGGKDDEGDDT